MGFRDVAKVKEIICDVLSEHDDGQPHEIKIYLSISDTLVLEFDDVLFDLDTGIIAGKGFLLRRIEDALGKELGITWH